jgi:hypothetical protein
MGKLHDALKAVGYIGHKLEVYLVHLLFCLLAEGAAIFENACFKITLKPKSARMAVI